MSESNCDVDDIKYQLSVMNERLDAMYERICDISPLSQENVRKKYAENYRKGVMKNIRKEIFDITQMIQRESEFDHMRFILRLTRMVAMLTDYVDEEHSSS